jgi:hypothetical protein
VFQESEGAAGLQHSPYFRKGGVRVLHAAENQGCHDGIKTVVREWEALGGSGHNLHGQGRLTDLCFRPAKHVRVRFRQGDPVRSEIGAKVLAGPRPDLQDMALGRANDGTAERAHLPVPEATPERSKNRVAFAQRWHCFLPPFTAA